jgi:hypothetical protein
VAPSVAGNRTVVRGRLRRRDLQGGRRRQPATRSGDVRCMPIMLHICRRWGLLRLLVCCLVPWSCEPAPDFVAIQDAPALSTAAADTGVQATAGRAPAARSGQVDAKWRRRSACGRHAAGTHVCSTASARGERANRHQSGSRPANVVFERGRRHGHFRRLQGWEIPATLACDVPSLPELSPNVERHARSTEGVGGQCAGCAKPDIAIAAQLCATSAQIRCLEPLADRSAPRSGWISARARLPFAAASPVQRKVTMVRPTAKHLPLAPFRPHMDRSQALTFRTAISMWIVAFGASCSSNATNAAPIAPSDGSTDTSTTPSSADAGNVLPPLGGGGPPDCTGPCCDVPQAGAGCSAADTDASCPSSVRCSGGLGLPFAVVCDGTHWSARGGDCGDSGVADNGCPTSQPQDGHGCSLADATSCQYSLICSGSCDAGSTSAVDAGSDAAAGSSMAGVGCAAVSGKVGPAICSGGHWATQSLGTCP